MKNILLTIVLLFGAKAFGQNVGINITTPKEKLHVKGTMRFEPVVTATNPAPQPGYVIQSDANGNATWRNVTLPINPSVTATYNTSGVDLLNTGPTTSLAVYTGTSITLPPGNWIVTFAMDISVFMSDGTVLPNNRSVWIRSSLFDGTATEDYTNSSADIQDRPLISKEIVGPATHAMMIGEFKIKNSGTTAKTYYYKVNSENVNFTSSETSKLVGFGVGPQQNPSNRIYANIASTTIQ